jgi:hypothetical protein
MSPQEVPDKKNGSNKESDSDSSYKTRALELSAKYPTLIPPVISATAYGGVMLPFALIVGSPLQTLKIIMQQHTGVPLNKIPTDMFRKRLGNVAEPFTLRQTVSSAVGAGTEAAVPFNDGPVFKAFNMALGESLSMMRIEMREICAGLNKPHLPFGGIFSKVLPCTFIRNYAFWLTGEAAGPALNSAWKTFGEAGCVKEEKPPVSAYVVANAIAALVCVGLGMPPDRVLVESCNSGKGIWESAKSVWRGPQGGSVADVVKNIYAGGASRALMCMLALTPATMIASDMMKRIDEEQQTYNARKGDGYVDKLLNEQKKSKERDGNGKGS